MAEGKDDRLRIGLGARGNQRQNSDHEILSEFRYEEEANPSDVLHPLPPAAVIFLVMGLALQFSVIHEPIATRIAARVGCCRLEGDSPAACGGIDAEPGGSDGARGAREPLDDLSGAEPDAVDVDFDRQAAAEARGARVF
jgi:hypothetical protein